MASGRKPVIVRKFSRDWIAGYAAAEQGLDQAEFELLDQAGRVLRINWDQVKWVCYLRDLGAPAADAINPEGILVKRFRVLPRTAGLWVRITLADHDELEGIAANDASLVSGIGLLLTPPDTRSNAQRIFVPRLAIRSFEVLSLIGANSQRGVSAQSAAQTSLFPTDPDTPGQAAQEPLTSE